MYILTGIVIFFVTILTRIWIRIFKRDFGVDTWYFLNYADAFRKQKKLPVKLKHYLLDIEEQWYPPFLPFIISIFSKRIAEKYHWIFSAVIDSLQAIILYIFILHLLHRFDLAIFSSFLYISGTINASMSTNLNSRPLASLLLTLLMLAIYYFKLEQGILYIVPVLCFGAILLHTHKMATQQFLFLSIGLAIITRDVTYIIVALLIFIFAILITRGHYIKILKNNIQIIKYWSRNLHHLGKHPIYDSVLYVNKEKALLKTTVSGLKNNNFMFFLAKMQLLTFLIIILIFWITPKNILSITNMPFFFYWVFINYCTVIVTTYLPFFKYFGEGFNYLIYGVFPVSFLVPYTLTSLIPNNSITYPILFILIVINFCVQIFTLSRQLLNTHSFVDEELKHIINILKNAPEDNIMCLPVSKAEPIAYFADKRVLWGAHGSGWDYLDEIYPIVKVPIEDLINKHNVSMLLLDKRFVDSIDLKIDKYTQIVFDGRNYSLLKIKRNIYEEKV